MENILMRFCRETKRYTVKTVATKLGISVDDYIGVETGEILLTEEQAKILGKLYNAHSSYFNDEAIQLDLLITKIEIIKTLKAKITFLEHLTK
jgi:transcriptional regulator with XRE-family HTH domain